MEHQKSAVRCKVEHPFLIVKKQMGYSKVVYRGITKNMHRFHMLFASANLLMCGRAPVSVQENDRVEIIALCDYKIHGCTGCSSCQKDTGHFICVQKDDGNLLLGKIRKVVDEMKA